jgi:membrane associated rhomboid family serine protease
MARPPVLTIIMLAILVAIFVGELEYAPPQAGMTPSLDTLVALGGLMRNLVVERHEWFRIFTAALLHADPMHILFNGIAFFFSARALERLLGRLWLLTLFFSARSAVPSCRWRPIRRTWSQSVLLAQSCASSPLPGSLPIAARQGRHAGRSRYAWHAC